MNSPTAGMENQGMFNITFQRTWWDKKKWINIISATRYHKFQDVLLGIKAYL